MTYNSRNYAREPLAAVIDALETGAEALREFDQWIESEGFQTFGEWIIKAIVPDEEQPRVIITPPPKKENNTIHVRQWTFSSKYDPYAHASETIRTIHEHLRALPGTTVWKDFVNDVTKVRCHYCNEVLTLEHYDIDRSGEYFRRTVGMWYTHHGPNCGRVDVVHNGKEIVT